MTTTFVVVAAGSGLRVAAGAREESTGCVGCCGRRRQKSLPGKLKRSSKPHCAAAGRVRTTAPANAVTPTVATTTVLSSRLNVRPAAIDVPRTRGATLQFPGVGQALRHGP